jgi:hypothetical protein
MGYARNQLEIMTLDRQLWKAVGDCSCFDMYYGARLIAGRISSCFSSSSLSNVDDKPLVTVILSLNEPFWMFSDND